MNEQIKDNGLLTAPAIMTTAGDIMYASAANTPARLAKSTTSTQYLANTGTSNVPQWNEVALTTGVSGTLPVANGGTGITSLGSNVATFLGTPSSANLRSALTDETGTGGAVFATRPTLVTPALGTPSAAVLTNATGLPEAGLAVSTAPTNGYMLPAQSGDAGGMTWAAASSGLDAASQAEMEARSSNAVAVTPGRIRHNPNAASGWYKFPGGSGTSFSENENMASMTHPSAGVYTGNFTTAMDGDNLYCTIVSVESAAAGQTMSGYHMYSGGVSAYGAYHIVNEGSTTHVDLPHSVVFFGTLNA